MAYVNQASKWVKPAVSGELIQEGRLVRLAASGVHNDLEVALLAASGTTKNVYVAFVPPDNFPRPTPSDFYNNPQSIVTLNELGTFGDFTETKTFYHVGLSTLENPFMPSGYLLQAHRDTTVTVPSGCVIDTANLRINGALAKVSDDGTGRFQLTTVDLTAVARTVDWNPATLEYTFEILN